MNVETISKVMALVEEVETAAYGLSIEHHADDAWGCADNETRLAKAKGEIEALLHRESDSMDHVLGWNPVTVDQLKAGDCFEDPSIGRVYVVQDITESPITSGFFAVRVRRIGFNKDMSFGYPGSNVVYREES